MRSSGGICCTGGVAPVSDDVSASDRFDAWRGRFSPRRFVRVIRVARLDRLIEGVSQAPAVIRRGDALEAARLRGDLVLARLRAAWLEEQLDRRVRSEDDVRAALVLTRDLLLESLAADIQSAANPAAVIESWLKRFTHRAREAFPRMGLRGTSLVVDQGGRIGIAAAIDLPDDVRTAILSGDFARRRAHGVHGRFRIEVIRFPVGELDCQLVMALEPVDAQVLSDGPVDAWLELAAINVRQAMREAGEEHFER